MRRTLAVLALLATSWPHVVVLECALVSAAPRAAAAAAAPGPPTHSGTHPGTHHGPPPHAGGLAAIHHGVGHEHVPVPAAGTDAEAPPGGLACGMVMACGLVMIRAEGEASGAVASLAPQRMVPRTLAVPSAADLAADPPPPRDNA